MVEERAGKNGQPVRSLSFELVRGGVTEAVSGRGGCGGGDSVGGRAVRRMLAAARTTVTSHRPPEKQKEATRHHRDNQSVTRGRRKRIHQKMMQG